MASLKATLTPNLRAVGVQGVAPSSKLALAPLAGELAANLALAQNQPLKAEEAFKNIQGPKGISAAEFVGMGCAPQVSGVSVF